MVINRSLLISQGFETLLEYAGTPNFPQTSSFNLILNRFNKQREKFGLLVLKYYPFLVTKTNNKLGEYRYDFTKFIVLIKKFVP